MLRQPLSANSVDRFAIVGPLGSGGFGAVYEAVDGRTGQRVALKELDNTGGDAIARFKHEFRAMSDCHHPNLVRLLELIEKDGRWMIVMELVPGCDLMDYIRGPARTTDEGALAFDEGRLRSALTGVVEGLRALHGFGILHRDLKPSNVRVRPDGRAVLLDFGLATSVHPQQQSRHGMVGTVRYMAPEQVVGHQLGPETDLYALGVCLFEGLTGHTPFDGENAIAIVLAKQREAAPRASSLNPSVPADLDDLCARLLATDPAGRPSADEVLLALGGRPAAPALPPPPQVEFAGRERELEHLERALATTYRGELRLVLVEGESGVGKSELVAEFLRQNAERSARFLSLRGRCYENEQVSYKAFDGCVDELAKQLRRMSDAECAALMPSRAALLGQLFPVLRTLRAVARAPREDIAADPTARRLEAFDALASLLGKLAEEQELVLVIDDLQWADAESFRMLSALVERPLAPPILIVATVRPREELDPQVFESLKAIRAWKCTDVISLFGLPRIQAKALAAKLLGPSAPDAWLDLIAEESGGHPLFLSELVQYSQDRDLGSRGGITLEAALRARIQRLDAASLALLEITALAARPHGVHVLARALAVPTIDEPARRLLAEKLLKARRGHELGCFHDRIRHAVVDLLGHARSIVLHRRLAEALSADPESDPVEQAHHWDLAGDHERALAAYEMAVSRAIEALAFTHAAELSSRALTLIDNPGDPRACQLLAQRAHALAYSGRCQEAAKLYQEAADRAHGEERIRHRASAAVQLMLGGQAVAGFDAARSLLRELGVRLPLSPAAILLRFAWDRLKLAVTPEPKYPETETLERPVLAQILEQFATPLALVRPLSVLSLAMDILLVARRERLPSDAARGLAMLGWMTAVGRSFASAAPLFTRARGLMRNSHPSVLVNYLLSEGSARVSGADFVEARACLERAEELARVHRLPSPWVITVARYHLGVAWFFLGEHERLSRESATWLAETRERNDIMGEALLAGMGYGFVRHLMADAPSAALDEHDRLLASLQPEPYTFAHFGLFVGKVQTLLYQGGPKALHFLERFESERARIPFFKTRLASDSFAAYLIEALFMAADGAPPDERARLLRRVAALVRRLRTGSVLFVAFADLNGAQLAAFENRPTRALELARRARARFEQMGSSLHWNALYLEGALEGGEGGRKKRESAIAAFRKQGWVRPIRGILMNMPIPTQFVARDEAMSIDEAGRIGRFQVLAPIVRGGRGSIVAACDPETGRKVALKELVRGTGKSLERFKREFRALQELHHPNLVRVEALLEREGRWYMVMELVEGTDLTTYLREGGGSERTVCRLMAGIARGLLAVHDAGFAHREVTPWNVRVTSEGRAVLIDFGHIARVGEKLDGAPIGSTEYAAPELLAGAPASPSSDVYALGVCLHEGLFGSLPGHASGHPTRSSASPELSAVHDCSVRMRAPEPERRPSLSDVLTVLELASEDSEHARASVEESLSFSGRSDELEQLSEAFEATCDVGFTLAFVEGESGVGKSALVFEFARRCASGWPGLRILHGRCYENERVAFKAFDGAIDQVAALLRALPTPECEALLPKRAALLGQLFPVLSSVPAIADASRKGLPADPATQKRAALASLLGLFQNLGAHHELLFVVDDLQWADDESFALLSSMTAQREKLPFLFVCTVRPDSELSPETARQIEQLRRGENSRSIVLEGLSDTAAREVALAIHKGPIDEQRLEAMVKESKGHPLFLRELVNQERRGGVHKTLRALKLEGAVRAHIASLSEDARALLTMVALAGRPLGVHLHARAMGKSEVPRDALISLLAQGLLRLRGDNEITCYHDRIRQVAVDMLKADDRRRAAESLASALEGAGTADPAERARLWDEAGATVRAIDAYEQAGDRALAGFGFVQADKHYARAIELLSQTGAEDDPGRTCRLLEQRGHALVRAGRSADAARLFQLAAAGAKDEAQVRLRIWAAQHLIQSAQVEEGMGAARALLRELGLSLPETDRSALARIAIERARITWRGTKLRRHARLDTERERMQLEALHGLSSPVRAISYLPGSMLVAQYLRRALKAGAPIHTARALAFEGLFRTIKEPDKAESPLFEQSRELAERVGEPAVLAEVDLIRGLACTSRNDFARAPLYLSNAHEILSSSCPGEPWLLTAARMYLGFAWYFTGDLASISRYAGGWIDEARARDDRYAVAALAGFGWACLRHVPANRLDDAMREIEEALAPWPPEPFTTNHLGAFQAMGAVLSLARPAALLSWVDADAPRRRRAYLMRTPPCEFVELTARIAGVVNLLACERGEKREALFARADVELGRMRANRSKAANGFALTFAGIVQCAKGERSQALRSFSTAATDLPKVGSVFFAKRARYLEGILEGGESGREKCAPFVLQVAAQGWSDLERGLDFWVAGRQLVSP